MSLIIAALFKNHVTAAPLDFHCGVRFRQQLETSASIVWSDVPLRDGLTRLSRAHRVGVWLDRRVVPDQLVTLTVGESPLQACLVKLADQQELDVSWIDCLIYLGPRESADRFGTVHEVQQQLLAKLPRKPRTQWNRPQAVSWPMLTEPRAIVAAVEQEVGYKITGQDQIPHDLWPSVELPALPAYARLGIVLAGFDLTFLWNRDGSVRIVEMPKRPVLQQTYTLSSQKQQQEIEQVVETFSTARLTFSGKRAQLVGSWRVHEKVRTALESDAKPAKHLETAEVRYTLRGVNQPVGPLIEKLAERFALRCEFSLAARRNYGQRVSFDAHEVAQAELFRMILALADLRSEVKGDVLHVSSELE